MKVSSVQLTLFVLVAVAAVVTSLSPTENNGGDVKARVPRQGPGYLTKLQNNNEPHWKGFVPRTTPRTTPHPSLANHREKRGTFPGYPQQNCQCPVCPGSGWGSANPRRG